MSNVHLRKLSITLGGKPIIRELDLQVEPGEFLVLLGPSGCGKSTLLHSIAGLIEASGGSIEIGGRDMTLCDPSERGIGMVFQSYALYPTMTVEGNMSFGLKMAGTPKAEIKRRVAHAAGMLQLDSLLSRKPAQLSGGQRQRVAIGRALVREAGVFLFDEPLSNLDAKLRAELRRELKLLHARLKSTMIYVTHDQVEAMTLASRIVVMQGGMVQQIGTPLDVYERPANRFVAGFLGSPAMNFIEGEVDLHGRFLAGPLAVVLQEAPAPCSATLGVRPEHVRIGANGPLDGEVTLVEPMGNHQIVWIACGSHLLSALVHEGGSFAPGQPVRFGIDATRVSLFDTAHGMRFKAAGMQYASV
ncbi:ABC transporter ATP-binding protein [Massilia sp. Dwa41.01b]|uniref:ABC transporter ATP-binding protein n=1 Tax=unclassified Massilia TaxID=2609279 RepID=UPI001604820B|nr:MULTISPECIES: ABC transporter ATP-binding protein [unclassified Massilia]QNA88264.1 ABC transporter ATP-binding protein [Massilia sp. Dwa41.01b]QNA99165.1 ABC transporter ATP-binding protein [Massilia sp. Se16.2.3]